ncbi:MAG: hypothetical protein ABF868_12650 [Sporolactobacillus sp.]
MLRPLNEIIVRASKKGWIYNLEKYREGDDWVGFTDDDNGRFDFSVNVHSGCVRIYGLHTGKAMVLTEEQVREAKDLNGIFGIVYKKKTVDVEPTEHL